MNSIEIEYNANEKLTVSFAEEIPINNVLNKFTKAISIDVSKLDTSNITNMGKNV